MQQPHWIFAFASVIGNGHTSDNIPCQDACGVLQNDNYNITVVCDGAGSCENSQIGSKKVTDFCLYHFEKLIENKRWFESDLLPNDEIWHVEAKKALSNVRDDLEKFSMSNDLNFKSLSCTVIVNIIMQDCLFVTHIGDGRSGYCDQLGEWHSSITPFHGELANQTVFITSEIWDDEHIDNYIESRVVHEQVTAVCLLSDGCEKASFECNLFNQETETYYDPNKPFPLFFNPNKKILPTLHEQGHNQEEINSLWENFLTSGNDKLRLETDDKTMIFGVRLLNDYKVHV